VADNLVKKIVKKIKGKQADVKEKKETNDKLLGWKRKLNEAMSSHSSFRAYSNLWDAQYHDAREDTKIKGFMSSRKELSSAEELDSNVNITMQLIEGTIDVAVPKPAVSAIESADGMENRKMIEGMLTYMSEGSNLQKMVSENERITKKNGMSILKVSFNPDYNGHTYRGRLETTNPHPINFIPQPNVIKIEDMDYCFQIENKTLDQVCRIYGEEFRSKLSNEGSEYGDLENFGEESKSKTEDMVSVVECWYKDKDNEVSLLTWANEIIIRDLPKFYYPRDEAGNIEDMETLDVEQAEPTQPTDSMPVSEGQQPSQEPNQLDGQTNGEQPQNMPVEPPQTNTVTVERRVPKRFPFIAWYNIPKEKSFLGVSDCQIVKRQQDSIKRLITKEERKQNKGTTKIIVRKNSGLMSKLKDAESQILETDDPTGDLKAIDIKTPNNGAMELFNLQLQAAKDIVGVTEASQGRADSSTLSGKALETLSANTATRLNIKTNEKYIAFRELYQLYYDFLIAYYDDKVPYRVKSAAEIEYGYFDKSLLLKKDIAGEYYYPDFDIYINADAGMAKDKNFMIQVADKALEQGAADAIDYWMIMDSLGIPMSSFILERARERIKQQQADAQAQQEQQNQLQQQSEQAKQQAETQVQSQGQQPQEQAQGNVATQHTANPDELAGIIAQLTPSEQKIFFSLTPSEQQKHLDSMMNAEQQQGGDNNG